MNNKTFLFIVSFVAFSLSASFMSCGARDNAVNADVDELGDTVPASEFAIVEDTIPVAAVSDSVVAPDIKQSDK